MIRAATETIAATAAMETVAVEAPSILPADGVFGSGFFLGAGAGPAVPVADRCESSRRGASAAISFSKLCHNCASLLVGLAAAAEAVAITAAMVIILRDMMAKRVVVCV